MIHAKRPSATLRMAFSKLLLYSYNNISTSITLDTNVIPNSTIHTINQWNDIIFSFKNRQANANVTIG